MSSKNPFTPDQQAVLSAMSNVLKTLSRLYANEVERRVGIHLGALVRVLVEQDVISAETYEV